MGDPTAEMIAFFEQRTREHVSRVGRCLHLLASVTDHGDELRQRAKAHDASKLGPKERLPYIWLTEFHRCRRGGLPFAYPPDIEDQVRDAIRHHVTRNRHHPEFHADPNDMTDVDLIEMVCDWTAMALEYGEHGGSARAWADKSIGTRIHFNTERRALVYEMIAVLDHELA